MSDNIGVCGVIGSGKSHIAQVIASRRNMRYVAADTVFKEDVLTNLEYAGKLREFFFDFLGPVYGAGFDPFQDGVYQTKHMSEFLFADPDDTVCADRLDTLNAFNSVFLTQALEARVHGSRCVLEMATLPDYARLSDLDVRKIVCVVDNTEMSAAFARDRHRDQAITARIADLQRRRRLTWHDRDDVLFLINRNRDSEYLTDTQIVDAFDSFGLTTSAL